MLSLLQIHLRDVLFAHWSVDPAVVADALPDGLVPDTYDGRAYLGVVPLEMADVRPPHVPISRSFPALNLRTYVRVGGEPGVYFFSLDAADRLGVAVARRLFSLPYHRSRMSFDSADGDVDVRSQRRGPSESVRFEATYRRGGDLNRAPPGSLSSFLTERYRFYVAGDRGVYYGTVDHAPWRLARAEATVRANDLFAASGFDRPTDDPLFHYSPGCVLTAGRLRRLRDGGTEADAAE